MLDPKSVLITGASGGLGSALARAYATHGRHLFLGDVDGDKLAKLCDECNELGAVAHGRVVDVTEKEAMEAWIAEADGTAALDLVIANAGISHGNLRREETAEQIRAVFAVNLDGTLNTVLPALPLLRTREEGSNRDHGFACLRPGFPSLALLLCVQGRGSGLGTGPSGSRPQGRRVCLCHYSGIRQDADDGRKSVRHAVAARGR